MGFLSFLLMLFLSQTQNSPRLPFQYIHHEIISPHSLIPGRLWYFNWVRRFNKKQTNKKWQGSHVASWGPLLAGRASWTWSAGKEGAGVGTKQWGDSSSSEFRSLVPGMLLETQLTAQVGSKAPRWWSLY